MPVPLKLFAASESGATSIEYALVAVLVAIGILGAVSALGDTLASIFSSVASDVTSALDR